MQRFPLLRRLGRLVHVRRGPAEQDDYAGVELLRLVRLRYGDESRG